jgi:hypothetical protein
MLWMQSTKFFEIFENIRHMCRGKIWIVWTKLSLENLDGYNIIINERVSFV